MPSRKGHLNRKCEGRNKILKLLSKGEHYFNEIERKTGLGTGTVNHHLKTLCEIGAVVKTKRGIRSYYSLTTMGHSWFEMMEASTRIRNSGIFRTLERHQESRTFSELVSKIKKQLNRDNAKKLLKSDGIDPDEIPVTKKSLEELKEWLDKYQKEYKTVKNEWENRNIGRRNKPWREDLKHDIPPKERKHHTLPEE